MHHDNLPQFLTVTEAADVLRIGRSSAYELARKWLFSAGETGIPCFRLGHTIRVPRDALLALAKGAIDSGATPDDGGERRAEAEADHLEEREVPQGDPSDRHRLEPRPALVHLTASAHRSKPPEHVAHGDAYRAPVEPVASDAIPPVGKVRR